MNQNKNFLNAFEKLREFTKTPCTTEREKAGVIQAFEFTFEQAWKLLQKISQAQGLEANSPKQALVAAIQMNLIAAADEPKWSKMLEDRNLSSHIYKEELADAIYDRVLSQHLSEFEKLKIKI